MSNNPSNLFRALRLPFASASILPFIFGSLLAGNDFNFLSFFLGLVCVLSTHLGANLINDYADSQSGADWQDRRFFGFFGGSKLIQERVFPERFYRNLSISLFMLAAGSAIGLALVLKSVALLGYFLLVLFLACGYSVKPWQFVYRRFGELVIFILFGPALVTGGYFLQTGIFPTLRGLLLSLPFGFLTCAILLANEVPDFVGDRHCGKLTWVGLFGPARTYILYIVLVGLAFLAIVLALGLRLLSPPAALSLLFVLPAVKAAGVLKNNYQDKHRLIESAKLTIAVQAMVSITLILRLLLKRQSSFFLLR